MATGNGLTKAGATLVRRTKWESVGRIARHSAALKSYFARIAIKWHAAIGATIGLKFDGSKDAPCNRSAKINLQDAAAPATGTKHLVCLGNRLHAVTSPR